MLEGAALSFRHLLSSALALAVDQFSSRCEKRRNLLHKKRRFQPQNVARSRGMPSLTIGLLQGEKTRKRKKESRTVGRLVGGNKSQLQTELHNTIKVLLLPRITATIFDPK